MRTNAAKEVVLKSWVGCCLRLFAGLVCLSVLLFGPVAARCAARVALCFYRAFVAGVRVAVIDADRRASQCLAKWGKHHQIVAVSRS